MAENRALAQRPGKSGDGAESPLTRAVFGCADEPGILPARLESSVMSQAFDVCIRGAGVVGRTLALLLARERLRVALCANAGQTPLPHSAADDRADGIPVAGKRSDVRAYALNAASRSLLQSVRGWPDAVAAGADSAHPAITAVCGMQVFGDDGGRVTFGDAGAGDAKAQRDADALAWIVDVPTLEQQLYEALRYQPLVERVAAPVAAPLTVICEGRTSISRDGVKADFDTSSYGQQAIATRARGEQPHGGVARQWFENGDILALLPLGGSQGHDVAVVWSVDEARLPSLLALDPSGFAARLQEASHDAVGSLTLTHERAAWPLQMAQARHWIGRFDDDTPKKPRAWAIAGDAAHTVHPLAGQGLNLGLADAEALAAALRERDYWRSVADPRLLRRYERSRKAGLLKMRAATDGLQRLFAHQNGRVQALRNWGMWGFERSGPLKAWAVRQAMGL